MIIAIEATFIFSAIFSLLLLLDYLKLLITFDISNTGQIPKRTNHNQYSQGTFLQHFPSGMSPWGTSLQFPNFIKIFKFIKINFWRWISCTAQPDFLATW